jgi:hypothetical protein
MKARWAIRLRGVVVACAMAAVTGGCATPKVELQAPPSPRIIDARVPPEPVNLTMHLKLEQAKTSAEELASHVTVAREPGISGDQSVVISVPESEAPGAQVQLDLQAGLGEQADAGGVAAMQFRTSSYLDQAEQQIERSLLQKGFRLLDRAKFEAKLRAERSQRALAADLTDSEKGQLQQLVQDREAQLITSTEYDEKRAALEEKFRRLREPDRAQPGRNELIDIAELIRATEDGENRADYILQVDTFAIRPASDETVNLFDFPDVEDACRDNAGLHQAIVDAGADTIVKPGFSATLKASLIRVADGEIVWVGRHRIGTQHVLADGFTITLPVTKRVSNAGAINSELAAFNATQRGLYEQCVFFKDEIERKVREKEFRNRRERDDAIAEYQATCDALSQARLNEPLAVSQAWTYAYEVQTPYTRPMLPTTDDIDRLSKRMAEATTLEERSQIRRKYREYQEFLGEHFTDLAELVSAELIGTVP